jgi:predicted AAA+ superfamily ATPase
VFSELAKTINPLLDSVRFWRSKAGAEVDFIVEHAGRILPIEVKSTIAAPRMTRSMRGFIEAYKPPLFIVATLSGAGDIAVSGTQVRVVPVHALADSVRQFVG